jgi:UDP-glucose 4-epimerase
VTRSLVTGAAGFIGSHVARHCLELGHDVVPVDDLSGGFANNVPSDAQFREGSVTDAAFVDGLFDDGGYDFVYHLAAYAAEGLSHFVRAFNYTNNVIGSVNVLNAR